METVKLSRIVKEFIPELYPCLRKQELNYKIVLRDGLSVLKPEDAKEIIQYSIYENQKDAYLH